MKWVHLGILFLVLIANTAIADRKDQEPVGIETWSKLINTRLDISYERGSHVCINLYNKAVKATNLSDEKRPLDYIYTLRKGIDKKLENQFDAFVQAGMLSKKSTKATDEFRLTPQGWGYSPYNDGFDKRICLITGHWTVGKITKYRPVSDQGAGLNVYLVDFEKSYVEYGWFKPMDKILFKLKRDIPKITQNLLLIQGEKGFFVYTGNRRQLEGHLPPLPSSKEIESLIASDETFLKSYCELARWALSHSAEPCTTADYLNIASSIKVFYSGMPSGNMSIFRFADFSDKNNPHLGIGYLYRTPGNTYHTEISTIYQ